MMPPPRAANFFGTGMHQEPNDIDADVRAAPMLFTDTGVFVPGLNQATSAIRPNSK